MKEKEILDVQFRKDSEGVLAVFPYKLFSENSEHVTCYGGGEFSPCVQFVNMNTKAASEEEYLPIKLELENMGLKLNVITKRSYSKYVKCLENKSVSNFKNI